MSERIDEPPAMSPVRDVPQLRANKSSALNLCDGSTKTGAADVDPAEAFPDGGLRAWLVLFGAMCMTLSTFGYVNAWGVFQAYYQENILQNTSPSSIAWIGSIQYSLVFFPGLFVGRLFDLGYLKLLTYPSSALLITATFLTGECTRYWQFLLCQGFAIGLASGVAWGPSTAVLAHWFKRRRGFALGFFSFGSSLGGTIFPIVVRKLIKIVGFQWTMRIVGFILVLTLGVGCMTLERRLPPGKVSGSLFDLRAFRSPAYTIYTLSAFFSFLGIYTVMTYIDVSATQAGVSSDFSFYLVAIVNATSGIGRLISGFIADTHGPMNAMIPMTVFAAVMTLAWPYAQNTRAFIIVAVLYGFSSSTYTSINQKPIMEMGDTDDLGRRTGMFQTILALGALAGPPISGAINSATGGFRAVGYYAGSVIIVGVVLMCITRHLVLRRLWGQI